MATHSNIPAWRIPKDREAWWTAVDGWQRHDWATKHSPGSITQSLLGNIQVRGAAAHGDLDGTLGHAVGLYSSGETSPCCGSLRVTWSGGKHRRFGLSELEVSYLHVLGKPATQHWGAFGAQGKLKDLTHQENEAPTLQSRQDRVVGSLLNKSAH